MSQENRTDDLKKYLLGLSRLGRADAYAVRWETATGAKGFAPRNKAVTEVVVKRHLAGLPSIGIYFPIGDLTKFAVLDADNHDEELNIEEVIDRVRPIAQRLENSGMTPRINISGGGKGIHIWLVWEKPQSCAAVRKFLEQTLEECGFTSGAGSVATKEIEIFPKQDRIDQEDFGNPIALPFSRASVPLDRDFRKIEWGEFQADVTSKLISRPVPIGDETAHDDDVLPVFKLHGDEFEVQAALKYIPANSYDTWIKMGLAIKHEFAEDGFSIWNDWSKSGGTKYTGEGDCRAKWDSFSPNGKIGLGSIFHLAQVGGWNGPSNSVIREMNARFAVLTTTSKTQIIVKNGDLRPEDDFVTLPKPVFIDRLRGEMVPSSDGLKEKVEKSKYWLSHPLRDQYYFLEFNPNNAPGGNNKTWNLWTGFSVKAIEGKWSRLKAHIFDNICRGDKEKYEWLLNWLALGVQKPGDVIGTAPVLMGLPGTGKGVLANSYGHLWGRHFTTITHGEHVTGRFNAHLVGKRFVFIDEGIFGGDRKNAGVIKTRVTEPIIILEQKGVDPIKFRNRMIFMVASNEASAVPADIGDRRWMVFDVGDSMREDHIYFRAIQDELDKGGYEAMLFELQHRNISVGPDPRKVIQNTALFEQIIRAQPSHIRYIYQILDTGRLPQNLVAGANITTIKALWSEMQENQPDHKWISMENLGRELRKIFKDVATAINGRYFIRYVTDGPVYGRSTQYTFSNLQKCRQQFERYIGCPVPWSNELREWVGDPSIGDGML